MGGSNEEVHWVLAGARGRGSGAGWRGSDGPRGFAAGTSSMATRARQGWLTEMVEVQFGQGRAGRLGGACAGPHTRWVMSASGAWVWGAAALAWPSREARRGMRRRSEQRGSVAGWPPAPAG